jgi:hypothetical protein
MSRGKESEKPKNYNFFLEQVWPARERQFLALPRQRCRKRMTGM